LSTPARSLSLSRSRSRSLPVRTLLTDSLSTLDLALQDKFENEALIANALPVDVWFHVDDLSSAHVYLRLPADKAIGDIPSETLEDCCQLVKANSIEGCKRKAVNIVYTPASNLKKTGNMVTGQVGYHSMKLVLERKVEKSTEIVNRWVLGPRCWRPGREARSPTHSFARWIARSLVRSLGRLNKTKEELFPDLEAEKAAWMEERKKERQDEAKEQRRAEKAEREEAMRMKEMLSYDRIMGEEDMVTNKELKEKYTSFEDYEDDFM